MSATGPTHLPLRADVGFASWPAFGEQRSGDRLLLQRGEGTLTLLLVDVAGHGDGAAAVAESLDLGPAEGRGTAPAALLTALDARLQGTVGASAGALVIDLAAASFCFAAVGSVQLHHSALGLLASQAGHLGVTRTRVREQRGALSARDTLVLFSDGVRLRGLADALPGLQGSAHQKAGGLLHLQGRTYDDGTVAWVDVDATNDCSWSAASSSGPSCPS